MPSDCLKILCQPYDLMIAQKSLPKLELLWKQQVNGSSRASLRNGLSKLQNKVDFLKAGHFISPSTRRCRSAQRTLVDAEKAVPKEVGIRRVTMDDRLENEKTGIRF
jgi:hypothetical protein